MEIVILGSRGFIGHHLVRHLKKNHHVIGLNRNPDENCHEWYCADITNYGEIDRAFYEITKTKEVDLIIHAAAMADPKPGVPLEIMWANNTLSTFNLCQVSCSPIIHLSSVVVYGSGVENIKHNEQATVKPSSVYGLTKMASENILDFFDIGNICHLRLCATVGKNMTHGVVPDFIKRLKTEEKFYAIGNQPGAIKPYLYIDDLLSAIDLVIDKQLRGVYNVCPSNKISIEEVAQACMQGLGIMKKIEWKSHLAWKGDNPIINVDNQLLVSKGWKPVFDSYGAVFKAVLDNL